MTELYQAILRAKRNISPPAKTRKAVYGKYADLESVLTSVEGPLAAEGLFISQSGITNIGETPVLRTSIIHAESGQSIHSDIPLVSKKSDDPQALGGSMTYARRYGITAILSIVADDDDDGNSGAGKEKDGSKKRPEPKQEQVTLEDVAAVMEGIENPLPKKLVDALINEYQRAGFDKDSEMMAEMRMLLNRDFGQLAELTEAEARTAAGHARKLKAKEAKRLTPESA